MGYRWGTSLQGAPPLKHLLGTVNVSWSRDLTCAVLYRNQGTTSTPRRREIRAEVAQRPGDSLWEPSPPGLVRRAPRRRHGTPKSCVQVALYRMALSSVSGVGEDVALSQDTEGEGRAPLELAEAIELVRSLRKWVRAERRVVAFCRVRFYAAAVPFRRAIAIGSVGDLQTGCGSQVWPRAGRRRPGPPRVRA